MKLRRVLATTIAAALIISINPAHAFDPNSPAKTVEEFIQEELGEFSTSQFKLTQLAAKIKTISCIKGKVVKKVSAIGTPKCPAGYKKK